MLARELKIGVFEFVGFLGQKKVWEKIAMGFDEGFVVAEDDSAEFAEFGLVDFGLREGEIVLVFGVEVRNGEGTEGGCAGGAHSDLGIYNFYCLIWFFITRL